eukprot:10383798-Lingulodinium_polyedra.AAC.1
MAGRREAAERTPQRGVNGPGAHGNAGMGGNLEPSGVAGDQQKVVKPEGFLDPHGQTGKVVN